MQELSKNKAPEFSGALFLTDNFQVMTFSQTNY